MEDQGEEDPCGEAEEQHGKPTAAGESSAVFPVEPWLQVHPQVLAGSSWFEAAGDPNQPAQLLDGRVSANASPQVDRDRSGILQIIVDPGREFLGGRVS